jgi:ATP-binding cassette subfamily B protein
VLFRSEVSIASLRGCLGVVPQEPFLFHGTLRDNIAFASPDVRDEDVAEAARLVGLGELIDRLPDGIGTVLQERGSSLSSGERQLVALARAFLHQPQVLILDEATSNLDLRSEQQVDRALDIVLARRTSLVIAHRLSTAMRADTIAVLHDGRLVETGSHDELVAASGLYASLYESWTRDSTRRRHQEGIT